MAKIIREAERDRTCKNPECEYHEKIGSMIKTGKSGRNDYYQCRRCKRGYSATYGTIFRRRRTQPEEILKVLKGIAEGNSIRGAGRIFGHSKDTVIDWLKDAGKHCESVEKELVNQFNFNQVQIDELWTFILKKTTHAVEGKIPKQRQ